MNRRSFLKRLGLLAAAPVAKPLAEVFKPDESGLLIKEETDFSTIGSEASVFVGDKDSYLAAGNSGWVKIKGRVTY